MSEPLRIGMVVEGPTDFLILEKLIERLLGERDFVLTLLKPELSEAFITVIGEDAGWPGVCRWCLQAARQSGGKISDNPLFSNHQLLILNLDADVAENRYSDGHIKDPFETQTLPCSQDCPPASATTDRLRNLALLWMGEQQLPFNIVFCMPSKSLETWILVALFPGDRIASSPVSECRLHTDRILQGKPKKRKLVSDGQKIPMMYRKFAQEFADNWDEVKRRCGEAQRFESEFLNAAQSV